MLVVSRYGRVDATHDCSPPQPKTVQLAPMKAHGNPCRHHGSITCYPTSASRVARTTHAISRACSCVPRMTRKRQRMGCVRTKVMSWSWILAAIARGCKVRLVPCWTRAVQPMAEMEAAAMATTAAQRVSVACRRWDCSCWIVALQTSSTYCQGVLTRAGRRPAPLVASRRCW